MHKCLRCGKRIDSLEQIKTGCECGSKIFVFNKEAVAVRQKETEGDGRLPDSYFAVISFREDDVENIKIVEEGIFSIDLDGLSRNPVVLKDQDGVYYIKIEPKGDNGRKC
ncbi:MAG: hypothetical protein N3G80_01025 [Candidatus Micrarchaeota archaeon]|nr:hypothetical protein [Candidatus Micrarchaeota archaeon]